MSQSRSRYSQWFWPLLWGVAMFTCPWPCLAAGQATLEERFADLRHRPAFRQAAWGVLVVSLDTGRRILAHRPHSLLKPASNAKLFTAALALDGLGSDYRIRTSLYARQPVGPDGTLHGDLIVFGRGDPSMAARFHEGDYQASLSSLGEAVQRAGIRRILGDVVGDETFFVASPFGSSWTWSDLQYYYGAEVSALTVDDNVIDLEFWPGDTVGRPLRMRCLPDDAGLTFLNWTSTSPRSGTRSLEVIRRPGDRTVRLLGSLPMEGGRVMDAVTVPQPGSWLVRRLARELVAAGVEIRGEARLRDGLMEGSFQTNGWLEVGFAESRPLHEMTTMMLKVSQNLHAHLLWLHTGTVLVPETNLTSEARAGTAMERFLQRAGIATAEVYLNEGSGLSRDALVSPASLVGLLRYMEDHPQGRFFQKGLPVAGGDGTLRRRLTEVGVADRVMAKTGTLRHVDTLAGYLTTVAGERLVFSLMLNNYLGTHEEARQALDELVRMLVGRGEPPGTDGLEPEARPGE